MSDLERRLAQLTPEQRRALTAKLSVAKQPAATDESGPANPVTDSLPAHNAVAEYAVADNAIAIIGMACRFPGGANSPSEFWRLLDEGVDAIEPVPADRWNAVEYFDSDPDAAGKGLLNSGGFINNVANFDADYFGIAPFEAQQMDPQQRLFLEVAMEALDSAGLTRAKLAGSACGVYVGVHSHSNDYYQMQSSNLALVDTYSSTGTAHSVIANRLSYFLDLRGPSMSIDTACSSSLVALHQACLSLRAGESDVAVAGGLNQMLLPDFGVSVTKLRVLSPTGRCRTFDAGADGIARGEGCGAVIVKRAADAIRDGDTILALIRGSAVNQDGATNGITAPSTPSQIAVIRKALSVAKMDASRVSFVETHGTGTVLGDPIEVEAINAVYGATRDADDPVVLGAVKTNIGHLEGAAGVAGVIKTVLCLQHERIPRNLHFNRLNPLLQFDARSIVLPVESRAWSSSLRGRTRAGAVSSFGFGGTNAHVIIEEAPLVRRAEGTSASTVDSGAPEVFPLVLSARTPIALRQLVDRWRSALRTTLQHESIRDLAYTTAVRRSAFAHRVVVTGCDTAQWADRLDAWNLMGDDDALPALKSGERRKIAFAFSGQGPQWFAMGRELLATEPVFREVIDRVARATSAHVPWNLLDELARDESSSRIHETEITQPAMYAIQMGLVSLWRSWGVDPDFVIAHSSGEIAAACTAGAIDLEEGARIAVLRGRAVGQSEGHGAMIAFPISASDAAIAITGFEDRVGVAAVNSPASVVFGGDELSLAIITDQLKARGIEGKSLNVRYASHSPQMEGPAAWLKEALGTVQHRVPTLPMFSSISHALVKHAVLDASHWGVGLRRSVDFAGGVRAALTAGCRVFVDVAPHPVLASSIGECADEVGVDVAAIASLRRGVSDRAQLLQSAAELFEAGVDVDWSVVLGGKGRVVNVPAYPWQHTSFWLRQQPGRIAGAITKANAIPQHSAALETVHDVVWIPVPALAAPSSISSAYIILGGIPELAGKIAARLRAQSRATVEILSELGDAQSIQRRLELGAEVIDLRALDFVQSGNIAHDATDCTMRVQSLLNIAIARDERDHELERRMWFITRDAMRVNANETPVPQHAGIWGMVRVAQAELEATRCRLIDLESSMDSESDVDAVVDAVVRGSDEYEFAYRNQLAFVPRLQPADVVAASPALRADGYYVIAGGLGGVGRVVAKWLVAQGAKRILLIGRTSLPARQLWSDFSLDEKTRARVSHVQMLERAGAEVAVAAVDASDVQLVRALSDERRASGWGTAHGVLHCATESQFGLIPDITESVTLNMMRSKIGVAESLAAGFAVDAPDFLMLFSSMAAWLGERGQGAYAAANAVLEAWSIARRNSGVAISVINWGAWSDTGLADTRGGALVNDALVQRGVGALSPDDATAALGAVIAARRTSATVFRPTAAEMAPPRLDVWNLLRDLPGSRSAGVVTDKGSIVDELRSLSEPTEQRLRLSALVRTITANALGLNASHIEPDRPLGTLGMDSLMAMRIRRQCERTFGITLPATALFSYPTVSALAQLLCEKLGLGLNPKAESVAVSRVGDSVLANLETSAVNALTDDEALSELRSRRTKRASA